MTQQQQKCAYCGVNFPKPRKHRHCCSPECSAHLAQARRGRALWSEPEVDYLRDRLGSMPYSRLVDGFQRNSKANGYPKRSRKAIEERIKRLISDENYSRKCTLNNWTRNELARVLGVSRECVRSWCRWRKLKSTKVSRNQLAISRAAFRAWATTHPELVAHVEADRLLFVLEDAELVGQIKSHQPNVRGYARPVICLADRQTYPSLNAAARATYYSPKTISRAIKKGRGWAWAESTQQRA